MTRGVVVGVVDVCGGGACDMSTGLGSRESYDGVIDWRLLPPPIDDDPLVDESRLPARARFRPSLAFCFDSGVDEDDEKLALAAALLFFLPCERPPPPPPSESAVAMMISSSCGDASCDKSALRRLRRPPAGGAVADVEDVDGCCDWWTSSGKRPVQGEEPPAGEGLRKLLDDDDVGGAAVDGGICTDGPTFDCDIAFASSCRGCSNMVVVVVVTFVMIMPFNKPDALPCFAMSGLSRPLTWGRVADGVLCAAPIESLWSATFDAVGGSPGRK